jgi:hypothetical protein
VTPVVDALPAGRLQMALISSRKEDAVRLRQGTAGATIGS